MRLRARLFHVLVIALAVATFAAVPGSSLHAQAAAAVPPRPIVIAIDPGHGGAPDPQNPTQPFDPGAISAGGLMEKVVTLDVAQRVAALLREDLVAPVLTRNTDTWLTIADREQIGIDAGAERFVSIHCNSYQDASATGSLVLYPGPSSLQFAQTMSDALTQGLSPAGVPGDGVQLRSDWWIHNPMPTATVEIAYLSNPREAALLGSPEFRQQVAVAIRDGIERSDPDIATRRSEILAWLRAHPGSAPPSLTGKTPHPRAAAPAPRPGGSPLGAVVASLILALAVAAAARWRRPLRRALAYIGPPALEVAARAGDAAEAVRRRSSLHRASARRRRRRLRLDSLAAVADRRWVQHSVYDDLPF